MMRIIWKPEYLINLKLRNDLYTIAQLEGNFVVHFLIYLMHMVCGKILI